MNQAEFARAFHLPINTLREWEQHRNSPDAPALIVLTAPAIAQRVQWVVPPAGISRVRSINWALGDRRFTVAHQPIDPAS